MANLSGVKNAAGTTTYFDGSGNLSNVYLDGNNTGGGFETSSVLKFRQSTAPTGWTKDVTHSDSSFRLVNGNVSQKTDGVNFTVPYNRTASDGTSLTNTTNPSHRHTVGYLHGEYQSARIWNIGYAGYENRNFGGTNAGSGQAHNHTIDMRINYVDVILATKS